MTIDEVAHHLRVSHCSAHGIVQDRLGFYKVRARWVSKQLTGEHKRNRLTIFQGILNFYLNEGDAFLRRRVTEDET
jgi:hypothetical protein